MRKKSGIKVRKTDGHRESKIQCKKLSSKLTVRNYEDPGKPTGDLLRTQPKNPTTCLYIPTEQRNCEIFKNAAYIQE